MTVSNALLRKPWCMRLLNTNIRTASSLRMIMLHPIRRQCAAAGAAAVPSASSSSSSSPCVCFNAFPQSPLFTQQQQQQQKRTFATSPQKKKKKSSSMGRAADGRVLMHQVTHKTKKVGTSALCQGCGAQVVFISPPPSSSSKSSKMGNYDSTRDSILLAGAQAADATNLSKSQSKKLRYVDAIDELSGRKKGGPQFLCDRCIALRQASVEASKASSHRHDNNHDNNDNDDHHTPVTNTSNNSIWRAYDALQDVDADVFGKQLQFIVRRRQFGICLVVVDATDAEHSAPKQLRDKFIGKLPAWLIINKIDLLPRTEARDVRQLLRNVQRVAGVRFERVFAVSAVTGRGVYDLAEQLLLSLRGRDVFCLGAANVGKSTLVQALSSRIAEAVYMKGPARAAHNRKEALQQLNVTASHLPGTTLQAVRIPCFSSDKHALWDTPGVINRKAIQYSLFPSHLMVPLTQPLPIPAPFDEQHDNDDDQDHDREYGERERKSNPRMAHVRPGQSILIEATWMDGFTDAQSSTTANITNKHDKHGSDRTDDTNDQHDKSDLDKDLDEFANNNNHDSKKTKHVRGSSSSSSSSSPCVLGRIDVVDNEWIRPVQVVAFLHPALRMRIVPTANWAPSHATIPESYVHYVQSQMTDATSRQKLGAKAYSKPLLPFKHPNNPQGHVQPTEKEMGGDGWYHMDIVFPSLGWISMHNEKMFTVKPHCVEGSVFSKRPALYPKHLRACHVPEYEEDGWMEMDAESRQRRLREAAKMGRHGQGEGKRRGHSRDDRFQFYDDGESYEDFDFY